MSTTAAAPRTPTATTSTTATRVIGIAALIGIAWQMVFGLFLSPDDAIQGTAVRFLYLHVPAVSCAYLGFTCCALASVVYLRKRTLRWDRFAGASGEVGLLFMAITLLTGALWGKKTWGVYWAWDARLTTTALLFLLFLGYVAVRGLEAAPEIRARRSAIVGIFAAANIPIVNQSVKWWRSLHQGSTFSVTKVEIDGLMLFSTFVGLIAFLLVFVWMVMHRLRIAQLEAVLESKGVDLAIAERIAEAAVPR